MKGNTNYQADTADREQQRTQALPQVLRARAIGAGMGAAAGVWLGGLPTVIGIVIGQLPAVYNRTYRSSYALAANPQCSQNSVVEC